MRGHQDFGFGHGPFAGHCGPFGIFEPPGPHFGCHPFGHHHGGGGHGLRFPPRDFGPWSTFGPHGRPDCERTGGQRDESPNRRHEGPCGRRHHPFHKHWDNRGPSKKHGCGCGRNQSDSDDEHHGSHPWRRQRHTFAGPHRFSPWGHWRHFERSTCACGNEKRADANQDEDEAVNSSDCPRSACRAGRFESGCRNCCRKSKKHGAAGTTKVVETSGNDAERDPSTTVFVQRIIVEPRASSV